MKRSIWKSVILGVAAVALLAACSDNGDEAPSEDATPTEEEAPSSDVTVTATEYAFSLTSETWAAGEVDVELVNDGAEDHQMIVAQLLDGKTVDDVQAALEAGVTKPPKWFKMVGQAGAKPDQTKSTTLDVEAGTYTMLCLVPDKDGTPHANLGMFQGFTVA